MSAPIVYSGDAAGEGGTLFQGHKFWLAQRTPMRRTWLNHIKVYPRRYFLFLAQSTLTSPQNNGGQIVALEKNADFMIADHVRKDSPQGSYSWKWIEDSVKKGKLLDADDYLIGGKPEEQPRAGPSAPGKSTRTPFTEEDDRILMQWVLRRERQGESILGNKIYQELAIKNPRHTFQSWRDRWVKKVSMKPRPDVPCEEPEAQDAEETEPTASLQRTAASSRPQPTPSPVKQERKSRAKFTAEEDRELTQYVLERTANTGHDRGNKVFQEYADEHPEHTYQAYRDRWIKYLRPSHLDDENENEEEEVPKARVSRSKTNAIQSTGFERPDLSLERPTVNPKTVKGRSNITVEKPQSSRRGNSHNLTQQQDVPAPDSPGHIRVSPRNLKKMETQVEVDQQLNEENFFEEERPQDVQTPVATNKGKASPAKANYTGTLLQSKEEFYPVYQDFVQRFTRIRPNFWPTVRNQSFDLWDLWQSAVSQKLDRAERDWQQIAENLGYNWIEHEGVEDDIREIYENHLAKFEESLAEWENDESDDSETDEDAPDETTAVIGVSDAFDRNSEEQFNSSPPKQPSLKRTHEAALLSDLRYPDSSGKRQRFDRDSEIPSTPDTKNGTAHLRRPVSAAVSPSDLRMTTLPKSSSSRARQSAQKDQGVPDNGDRTIINSAKVHPKMRMVEPETQDFRYDPETQNIDFDTEMDDVQGESQVTVTASQQLHHESEPGSSPIKPAHRELARPSTPTPKRKAGKPPFVDSPDDEHDQPTPKERFGKGKNPILADLEKEQHQKQLRRISAGSPQKKPIVAPQPKPQRQSVSHPAESRPPPPSFPSSSKPSSKSAKLPPSSSRNSKALPPASPAGTAPKPPASSAKDDPVASQLARLNRRIDHLVSLGYPPSVARRAQEATSWQKGLVNEIIEGLKKGEPLPTNIEGVWTAKDDMKLQSLLEYEAAGDTSDEKQARKMGKFKDHLMTKHGEAHMELRKIWYEDKKRLGWEEME
ncbi:TRF2-interacting telomeric protein/Rap1 C terminal domain-containing protein [Apiospora aurea]|uniref:DNA-binding protein RAP1 n=1 Tax=Apiospora aurea TaxID=335848 RepID=A0ABR1PY79_9PEZI